MNQYSKRLKGSMTELDFKSVFLSKTSQDWRALVETGLRGANYGSLTRETEDGISRGPLVRAEDLPETLAHLARSDLPLLGSRHWHIAAPVRHPNLGLANTQLLEDLKGGASAARIEAGADISSRNKLKRLLEGVHADLIPIQFAPAPSNSTRFEVARDLEVFESSVFWAGLDPIIDSELLTENTEIVPDNWRLMGLSAAASHEAGGTEKQELAVLAASLVEAMKLHGSAKVCQHMVVELAADQDTHLTIAKFRAARRIIRRVTEAFGQDGSAIPLCAVTSRRMMQSVDAWTNLLRVMSAGLGAVIGGADMVTARPFTDSLGHATPFAHRIARNMQIMMMEESHLGQVSDAALGSYWHETTSEKLAQSAWTYFQSIEAAGGISTFRKSGQLQTDLEASVAARAVTDAPILGVTLHPAEGVKAPEVLS